MYIYIYIYHIYTAHLIPRQNQKNVHAFFKPTPRFKKIIQIYQIMGFTHCNTTLPEEGHPSRLFSKLILAICMPWIPSFVCGYTV